MRIAFDIDGVFADMSAGLARVAAELCATPDSAGIPTGGDQARAQQPRPHDLTGALEQRGLTSPPPGPRQQAHVWNRVRRLEDFWETLDEIEPGAVARLAGIAGRRRWHVLFLTERPETTGRPAQIQSQRWLQRRGFELPSVCITRGSRGRIAQALALDVMVDDRRDNCLDIRGGSEARVILVDRSRDDGTAGKAGRLGIECVSGVMSALDLLEQTAP